MKPHHAAWLALHPERSEGWLRERLREGFDVHHLDGDHGNNEPRNLVLIEHLDHMRLHGSVMGSGRMRAVAGKGGRKQARRVTLPNGKTIALMPYERAAHVLLRFKRDPDSSEWSVRVANGFASARKPKQERLEAKKRKQSLPTHTERVIASRLVALPNGIVIMRQPCERVAGILSRYRQNPDAEEWPLRACQP